MPRLTNKRVLGALRKSGGLVSLAAAQLGCSRRAIYDRINKYPAVAQALAEQRETFIDVAEAKLREKVNAGDMRAIEFALRTLGRHRGFNDKVEVEHTGTHEVRIRVEYGDEQGDRPRLHRPA